MDHIGDQQVDRRPWRIKEREQAVAGEKLTHLREILQGLGRIASGAVQVALECGGENASIEVHVEAVADPDQHAGAEHFKRGHQQEQAYHQNGQHRQRCDVATDQGSIIDLQHVNGWRQHHDVDDAAETRQGVKTTTKSEECVSQFGSRVRLLVHLADPLFKKPFALAEQQLTDLVPRVAVDTQVRSRANLVQISALLP